MTFILRAPGAPDGLTDKEHEIIFLASLGENEDIAEMAEVPQAEVDRVLKMVKWGSA